MITIKCDCGEWIKKDYNRCYLEVFLQGSLRRWSCRNCGQDWFEIVKEPKEIKND